jgi:hypothetical protein
MVTDSLDVFCNRRSGLQSAGGLPRAARKCSSHNAPCRPHPTATAHTESAKTFNDLAASSYG